ncbi:hypothetical protein [Nonlabens dokdonensis]|uniref:Uncharacterized protein n=2 Tax=Nonlabens dokdonensis TaxID=328515 RepID=L7WE00_NONDD|nr:hypothetical protein [Nonlabens dokdonensis]AGC77133.1 hypothetical protein DDD_2006 [Nonlabens dokdonensis DSW-6]
MLNNIIQGGSSTQWDAQHAFDEGTNSSSSYGILRFIVLLVLFVFALFVWGSFMGKKK